MKHMIMAAAVLISFAGGVPAQNTEIMYLSGTGNDDTVEWEFFCSAGRKSGAWTVIPVPSQWELEGFGAYNYGHDRPKADEFGIYRKTFSVPAGWAGRCVSVVFEGAMTDTEVLINGVSAGPVHQGGFYEFSYDISRLLHFGGTNVLEANVRKVSSDPSVEAAERQADYWVFGGIYRPVFLKAAPAEHVERIAIDARADGALTVDCFLSPIEAADSISARVYSLDGLPAGDAFAAPVRKDREEVRLCTRIQGCRTWTAETPDLYELRIALKQGDEVVHAVSRRFGFRTVEVRPDEGIFINGQQVLLKGVCRHSFWPSSGRTTSKALSIGDVLLMKGMNMNAVRMSHYPPDTHFLDACDSLGLYVLDELAGWQKPPYDTGIGKKLVREMVIRDVNHPSIIFWDNGNEGGFNPELDGEFGLYDPQERTVLRPWEFFGGIETDHYQPYDIAKRYMEKEIYVPTEFLHGLYDGGAGAGLEDYWDLMRTSPRGGGAFLWVFADEGVVRTDMDGFIDTQGNLAPDGIVGPYREKEESYYAVKEIWSPVHLNLNDAAGGLDGPVRVENRYDFTNLKTCTFTWELVDFSGPHDAGPPHRVRSSGVSEGPNVGPHASGYLYLDLPPDWAGHDALYVTACDAGGNDIMTWSKIIRSREGLIGPVWKASSPPVAASPAQDVIEAGSGGVRAQFGRKDGRLVSVSRNGRKISFGGGPRMEGGRSEETVVREYRDGETHVIDVSFRSSHFESVVWRIHPGGLLQLDYTFYLSGMHDYFGISFDYPEEKMKGMRWLGRGPGRVWKNRLAGTTEGVWDNTYKDNIPGKTWDYPHFKGYYADMYWVRFDTEEGPFAVRFGTPGMYLRVFTPKKAGGDLDRYTAVPFPGSDISFLHAIPAVGTKFLPANLLGPHGWPNQASGSYSGTLFFDFGEGFQE